MPRRFGENDHTSRPAGTVHMKLNLERAGCMEQGKPFSAMDSPLVDFDAVCQKMRAAIEPARAHAISLHDEKGDVLWLSESSMGPDEHNAVREAVETFSNPKTAPAIAVDLGDARSALLLRAVSSRRAMVGVAMLIMDSRCIKHDEHGAIKMMTPTLQRALMDFAGMRPDVEPATEPAPAPAARPGSAAAAVAASRPALATNASAAKPAPTPNPAPTSNPAAAPKPASAPNSAKAASAPGPASASKPTSPTAARPGRPQPPAPLAADAGRSAAPPPKPRAVAHRAPETRTASAQSAATRAASSQPTVARVAPHPVPGAATNGSAPASMASARAASHPGAPAGPRGAVNGSAPQGLSLSPTDPPRVTQSNGTGHAHATASADLLDQHPSAVPPEVDRLHAALRRSPIALHVQRLVPLTKGSQLRRYEVLLRSKSEEAPNAAPQAMLKAAVENGLGSMIDRRVLTELIGWLVRNPAVWQSSAVMFSVNLTTTALHDEHFIKFLGLCLAKSSLPRAMIAFEVDVLTAVSMPARVAEVAAALHRLGCPMVLDDFALKTECFDLLRLPGVRYIKLASDITTKMRSDKLSQASITAVVQMARVLGMHTVAKRTETAAEHEWLTALGVDFVQSHAMSPPAAIDSLSKNQSVPA
jgi:EAL domain-containing protein (putative c-di-GMP-specific phosphodiesterase class I)